MEYISLVDLDLRFNSLFEGHMSNTIKYTNIQQNKTYLIPSPFGLTRDTIDYNMVYYKASHVHKRYVCLRALSSQKGSIRFWARSDQHSGFHSNR